MNENYPLGSTMTFVPDEGTDLAFKPASISKTDALQIGLAFCEASDPEREAMLSDLGPIMVRRSLLVLTNVAARVGDRDAAAFARNLRSQITVLRTHRDEAAS
jgi:hypothetical protein